jgi:erythromycin esterase-like protein
MRLRAIVIALLCAAVWSCAEVGRPGAPEATIAERMAATALPIRPVPEDDPERFAPLARAIGDARVVMLGEPWHGDGGAIRLRAEIVRYLHRHLGFTVLAFEGDFFSLVRGWSALESADQVRPFAADNLFRFWVASAAAQRLWDYIEEQWGGGNRLQVAGIDPRHTGALARSALAAELEALLGEVPRVFPEERAQFRSTLERFLVEDWKFKPAVEERRRFLATLDLLERHLARREPHDAFLEQEAHSLRQGVLFNWQGASRDRAMAENFIWLATRMYPDRKIIVWAHNNHIIADRWMYYDATDPFIREGVTRMSQEQLGRATYLGHEVRQFFGNRVRSLATLSHSGRYSPDIRTLLTEPPGDWDSLATLTPTPEGSVEAALARAGHDIAFIDLAPFRCADPVTARVLDYSQLQPLRMRYGQGYDGFLFIHTTHGLNEEPPPALWPARAAPR